MSNEDDDEVRTREPGGFHRFYTSNPLSYLEYYSNKSHRASEELEFVRQRKQEWDAVVLSGFETAEMTGDGAGLYPSKFVTINPNNPTYDGQLQLRQVKFRFVKGAGSTAASNWTQQFASPTSQNLTPEEVNELIYLHPSCYSENEETGLNDLKFGDTIKVYKRGGCYFYRTTAERGILEQGEDLIKKYLGSSNGKEASSAFDSKSAGGPLNTLGEQITDDAKYPGAGLPIDMNLPGVRVSSRMGTRDHPVTGKKGSSHGGVDIAAPLNTPLYAVLDGEVLQARGTTIGGSEVGGFGAWVVTKHQTKDKDGKSKRIYVVYGHVNGSYVKKGEKITKGQPICVVGSEGGSTGPHLHIELHEKWWDPSSKIDPISGFGWDI